MSIKTLMVIHTGFVCSVCISNIKPTYSIKITTPKCEQTWLENGLRPRRGAGHNILSLVCSTSHIYCQAPSFIPLACFIVCFCYTPRPSSLLTLIVYECRYECRLTCVIKFIFLYTNRNIPVPCDSIWKIDNCRPMILHSPNVFVCNAHSC